MLQILYNISPVFLVIALGFFLRRMGFLPDAFIDSANRLVYHLAIPILLFREISRAPFAESVNGAQVAGTLLAVGVVSLLALALSSALRLPAPGRITFTQMSFHGNIGYVGLAVVFYVLGAGGLAGAGVLAGFLILTQNLLAVSLFTFIPRAGKKLSFLALGKFTSNPIILATGLGLLFSAAEWALPGPLEGTLRILGDSALPLALLVIGASLKPETRSRARLVGIATALKLAILPFAGMVFFHLLGVVPAQAAPALILLGSPCASISYVMAAEMGGDRELAAAAVTVSTVLSIITYTFWMTMSGL